MIDVVLYTRQGCHLCDDVKADLDALQTQVPHRLVVLDIDKDPALRSRYGLEVPVVKVGPYTLKAPFDRQTLLVSLRAEQDRQEQFLRLEETRFEAKWTFSDRLTDWMGKHYMAFFNLFVLIYVSLPVMAPVLMKAGLDGPAKLIYRGYGLACHQLSYRSFFLFGEQPFYPRAAAQMDEYLTYGQATGLSEANGLDDRWEAREFIGNETVGYKMALCERDIAIYGSILLFGLIFVLAGRRIRSIPWYIWILIALVPIGLDGVSQLLSQPPFNFFAERESTPYLRVLTGFLFGFSTAWFGYPMVEETMRDTRNYMAAKRERFKKATAMPASESEDLLGPDKDQAARDNIFRAGTKEPGND